MSTTLDDYREELWELVSRAAMVYQRIHGSRPSEKYKAATARLRREMDTFCLRFAIDLEIERAGEWLEMLQEENKEKITKKINLLTNKR